jgi:hypothetical protein
MLKRMVVSITAIVFFIGVTPAFGREGNGPTPNKNAYEHASDKAKFKRAGDVKNKDAEHAAKRAEKEAEKAKREIEKKAEKAKRETERQAEKAKREAEKEARKAQKKLGN